jgi:pescadillo protein
MLYCTITQCFKKAFFSIKGIYYQVEIMGQSITWIAPYQFNQRLPFNIDFKVMTTFLEFYLALLKFVNHKLFADLGLTPSAVLESAYLDEQLLLVDNVKLLQK